MKKIITILFVLVMFISCDQKTPQEKAQERLNETLKKNEEAEIELRRKTDSLLRIINAPVKD